MSKRLMNYYTEIDRLKCTLNDNLKLIILLKFINEYKEK